MAARSASRDGQVIAFWPATQGVMAAPWLVALFVPDETAYWLWFGGIVADLLYSTIGARNPKAIERSTETIRRQQEQEDRRQNRRFAKLLEIGRLTPADAPRPTLVSVAQVERGHLDERLGLFVIIVLGEAVAQVVAANTELAWTGPVIVASVMAFGVLVLLWRLTTLYGFSPAPRTTPPLEPFAALPAHLGVTASMIAIAAALGALIEEAGEHLADKERWYLFGGLALYFVTSAAAGLIGRAPLKWFLGWLLPSLLAVIAIAVFAHPLPGWSLTVLAFAVLAWFSTYNSLPAARERLTRVLRRQRPR
jgi:hypothetical protein